MNVTDLFKAQLEADAEATRRVLQRVPEGHNDWKPHEKSMPLGYLAALVATMPVWLAMMILQDEYEMTATGGGKYQPKAAATNRELLQMFETAVTEGRAALAGTDDEHLTKVWRLRVGGHVASELPRHVSIGNGVFSHLAHHRGQLTVYLRLLGQPVPAIFGPSADEGGFA